MAGTPEKNEQIKQTDFPFKDFECNIQIQKQNKLTGCTCISVVIDFNANIELCLEIFMKFK